MARLKRSSHQETARETIKNFKVLTLREEARKVFVDAILNPPSPNPAARAAAQCYKAEFAS